MNALHNQKGARRWALVSVLLLVATSYSIPAQAEFVKLNDPNITGPTDDGNNLTRDTATGLEWLDLTVTAQTSINTIEPRLADPGDELFGFRYATTDEVLELVQNYGFPAFGTSPGTATAAAFLADFGATDNCGIGPCSSGHWPIFGFPTVDAQAAQIVQRNNTAESTASLGGADRNQLRGNFLVRAPAPVPGMGPLGLGSLVILLVGSGSLAFAGHAKRRALAS